MIYPYVKFQPIPFGLPILASINSPSTAIYSSLDLLQLELSQPEFPWIVIGSIFLIGAVVGRAFCGWVCPIGFIQDIMTTLKNKLDLSPLEHTMVARNSSILFSSLLCLFSGTLGLALYLGGGIDYKSALGILASGPFTAISPDGTLFGTDPGTCKIGKRESLHPS